MFLRASHEFKFSHFVDLLSLIHVNIKTQFSSGTLMSSVWFSTVKQTLIDQLINDRMWVKHTRSCFGPEAAELKGLIDD